MKINASITILGDKDKVIIEVQDENASTKFLEIRMSPESFVNATMGRLALTRCTAEVSSLEKIGKKMEHKPFEFRMPIFIGANRGLTTRAQVKLVSPIGWEPDLYFSNRDSFFTKDGEEWARTTIRRWV